MPVVERGPVLYRRWNHNVIATMASGDERWVLAGLAAELWLLLDRARSTEFLAATLADHHRVSVERVAADVALALQSLGSLVSTTATLPSSRVGPAVPRPQAGVPILDQLALATGSGLGDRAPVAVAALQRSAGFRPFDPGRPVTEADVAACLGERVLPGLADALDEGALEAPDEVRQLVRETDQGVQVLSLTLEQTLLVVVDVMDRLGLEHRVLKGLATAHLDHAESRARQTGDVDVLVHLSDIDRVVDALVESGFTSLVDNPGPTALYKGVTVVSPGGIEIDLHHRLVRHGRPVCERAWANPEVFLLAGRPIACMGADSRRFHAAAHSLISTAGARRLGGHVDGLVLSRPDAEGNAMATAAGLAGVVARAEQLGGELTGRPAATRAALHGGRDRVCWWAFGRARRAVVAEQISLVLALPPRRWPTWIRSWVAPDDAYRVAWGRPGVRRQLVYLVSKAPCMGALDRTRVRDRR